MTRSKRINLRGDVTHSAFQYIVSAVNNTGKYTFHNHMRFHLVLL